jgi:hypothetical protein
LDDGVSLICFPTLNAHTNKHTPFLTMMPRNSILALVSFSSLGLNAYALVPFTSVSTNHLLTSSTRLHSDWSSFSALDDDDDLDMAIDTREYAKEEDSQELKAEVGASLEAPTIENDAEPIFTPAGSQLQLDEETVLGILSACREEIGTLFGYTAENRGVGITGGVDFVEMDGPVVVLSLKVRNEFSV